MAAYQFITTSKFLEVLQSQTEKDTLRLIEDSKKFLGLSAESTPSLNDLFFFMDQHVELNLQKQIDIQEILLSEDTERRTASARAFLNVDTDGVMGWEQLGLLLKESLSQCKAITTDIKTIRDGLRILIEEPIELQYYVAQPEKIRTISRYAVDGANQIYIARYIITPEGTIYYDAKPEEGDSEAIIPGRHFGVIDWDSVDFSQGVEAIQSVPRLVTVIHEGGVLKTMQGDHEENITRTMSEALMFDLLRPLDEGEESSAEVVQVENSAGIKFVTKHDQYAPKHSDGRFWKFEDLRGLGFAVEHLPGSTDENPTTFLVKNMNPVAFVEVDRDFAILDNAGIARKYEAGGFLRPGVQAIALGAFQTSWEPAPPVAAIVVQPQPPQA